MEIIMDEWRIIIPRELLYILKRARRALYEAY
jgi:hypothetical protein